MDSIKQYVDDSGVQNQNKYTFTSKILNDNSSLFVQFEKIFNKKIWYILQVNIIDINIKKRALKYSKIYDTKGNIIHSEITNDSNLKWKLIASSDNIYNIVCEGLKPLKITPLIRKIYLFKGYIYTSTDGLLEYCSANKYVPYKYVDLFNLKFNTINNYVNSIYYKLTDNEQKEFDAYFNNWLIENKTKNAQVQEELYLNYLKNNKNATRTDYCKFYDKNAEYIIQRKWDMFQSKYSNLYQE